MDFGALVVIDVQPRFMNTAHRVLAEIRHEVDQAIHLNLPVILVEYYDQGPTHEVLLDPLLKYQRLHVVIKRWDDGSLEILQKISERNLPRHLKLVGVNTNACVLRTAEGLITCAPDVMVDVSDRCCATATLTGHLGALDSMAQWPRVRIVDPPRIPRVWNQ